MYGKVKSFSDVKGYGFVGQENGPDVFVHYTDIVGEGYRTLKPGDSVEFEIVEVVQDRPHATNVVVIDDRD